MNSYQFKFIKKETNLEIKKMEVIPIEKKKTNTNNTFILNKLENKLIENKNHFKFDSIVDYNNKNKNSFNEIILKKNSSLSILKNEIIYKKNKINNRKVNFNINKETIDNIILDKPIIENDLKNFKFIIKFNF